MFKSAFISEYSLPVDEDVSRILKSHLLSNSQVIIPAGSFRNEEVSRLISDNSEILNTGVLKIAHGNDCEGLKSYLDKYPEIDWSSCTVDAFTEFGAKENVSIYDLKNTYERFNDIMKRCARGEIPTASPLFNSSRLNEEILSTEITNHLNYIQIMRKHISDPEQIRVFSSYMKYIYNLCGALSTKSGNTFSVENNSSFNFFEQSDSTFDVDSGLSLILSCALDVTDGIEDFNFLSTFENSHLDRLSFSDVIEIREHWLHGKIIAVYDSLVEECVEALNASSSQDHDKAIMHIDKAFEIKIYLTDFIRREVKKEISAYKIHRLCRFLADSSISFVSKLSGIGTAKSVAQFIYSATTEVAVLANKESHLKKLIENKTKKIESAAIHGQTIFGAKSPTLEYLRLVVGRLAD